MTNSELDIREMDAIENFQFKFCSTLTGRHISSHLTALLMRYY